MMTLPNVLLNTPGMNVMMAEDCNVPNLRVRPHQNRKTIHETARQPRGLGEANEAFLRMLTSR